MRNPLQKYVTFSGPDYLTLITCFMETENNVTIPDKSQIPDTEVVARVLKGEKALYELLMRRHNQKLYRAVRSYLKNKNEAEDAMQDTYLMAYEKLNQFKNKALFSTWLIRIGINVALGKLRETRHFAAAPIIEDVLLTKEAWLLNESNLMNPENIAIRQEVKRILEKAIDSIPEKYRIIYNLREVEGMPLNEIVQCLDLTESNVKVRLHRAKTMLKESLYKLSVNREVFEFGFKRCDSMVASVMTALP